MKNGLLILLAFVFTSILYGQHTWVLGSSLVDENLILNQPNNNFLRFFDIEPNGSNSSAKERELGKSIKDISSRGIQEICINAPKYNGEIPFYVFSNSGDGFTAFSQDELFFIKQINLDSIEDCGIKVPSINKFGSITILK